MQNARYDNISVEYYLIDFFLHVKICNWNIYFMKFKKNKCIIAICYIYDGIHDILSHNLFLYLFNDLLKSIHYTVVIFLVTCFLAWRVVVDTLVWLACSTAEDGWPDSSLNHLSNRATERLVYHVSVNQQNSNEYRISILLLRFVRNFLYFFWKVYLLLTYKIIINDIKNIIK